MKQILLVDDDVHVLESLLLLFHQHRQEWQVVTASNGDDALRLAREQPFDLIITDILMPEKDGIEMVIAFRREHPSVKIVAITFFNEVSVVFGRAPEPTEGSPTSVCGRWE